MREFSIPPTRSCLVRAAAATPYLSPLLRGVGPFPRVKDGSASGFVDDRQTTAGIGTSGAPGDAKNSLSWPSLRSFVPTLRGGGDGNPTIGTPPCPRSLGRVVQWPLILCAVAKKASGLAEGTQTRRPRTILDVPRRARRGSDRCSAEERCRSPNDGDAGPFSNYFLR